MTAHGDDPIHTALARHGAAVYLVGGAVRDALLTRAAPERDWVVVGATPAMMTAQGLRPVGRDFPVFLHPQTQEEYALARTERKTGRGYRGFQIHAAPDVTLEDDLRRRDLTINAMARSASGALVDPYGGQRDLRDRCLRHVAPAFVEDPVRVLRVARFAARYHHLGFTVADETMALMRAIAQHGEVDHLTPERVWRETEKALGERHPEIFFRVLRDCGALARIYPELDRLFGIPQTAQYHPEIDTGVHTLMALRQAARLSEDNAVRFAVLVHDLGKGLTPQAMLPSHRGHEQAGIAPVKALCARLRIPHHHRDLALMVCRWHLHTHKINELRPATIVSMLDALDAWRRPERLPAFALSCRADAQGRAGFEDNPYPQAEALLQLAQVAANVDAQTVIAAGFTGAQIGGELRRRRIAAIRHHRDSTGAVTRQPAGDRT